MNRHTAPPFRAPIGSPRTHVQEQCLETAALSPVFELWSSRHRPRQAKTHDENGRDSYGFTSARSLPAPPRGPGPIPTKDRFVFPWESELTAIEWACQNWLKQAHPEIHRELIWKACEHAGFLEDGQIPEHPPNPAPDLPETTR